MRQIYENVIEECPRDVLDEILNLIGSVSEGFPSYSCNRKGLHVPAVSFDGQWHNMAVRSLQKKPLTMLQLQKDVWRESEKTQKSEIVRMFENSNKSV